MTLRRRALALAATGMVFAATLTGCSIGDITVNESGQPVAVDDQGNERRIFTAGQGVPSLEQLHVDDILLAAASNPSGIVDSKGGTVDVESAMRLFSDVGADPEEGVQHALDFMSATHNLREWYRPSDETTSDVRRRASVVLVDPYILNMVTPDLERSIKENDPGTGMPAVFAGGTIGPHDDISRLHQSFTAPDIPPSTYTLPTLSVKQGENGESPALVVSGTRIIEWDTVDGYMLQPTTYSLTVVPEGDGWQISDMDHEMMSLFLAPETHVRAEKVAPTQDIVFFPSPEQASADSSITYYDPSVTKVFSESGDNVNSAIGYALTESEQFIEQKIRESASDGLDVHAGGRAELVDSKPADIGYYVSMLRANQSNEQNTLEVVGLSQADWHTANGPYQQYSTWSIFLEPEGDGWTITKRELDAELALPNPPKL